MTKTLLKFFCLLFLLGGLTSNGLAQFKVVGYQPYWAGSASSIQYSKLTHINYSFALPQSNGRLKALNNPAFLQQIVTNAHAVGTKVYIAIGGWSDNGTIINPTFEALASTATGRTNFVNDALYLVNTYNLDGVDIDWEFPTASTTSNFTLLMQQLYNALNPLGKGLSCAVSASSYYGNNIQSAVFGYIDHLNVMAYDNDQEANHSSYAYAQSAINLYVGKGCPKSKVILGVPFYGRPSWNSYSTLLSQGASPNSDQFGSDYYNGIPTIQSKTQLAWNTAGGIMIWELSQDASGANSLLSAIYTKKLSLGGASNQNPTVSLTTPTAGASYTAPASITISAIASDADGSITKVEFYNGSTLLNSDNTSPYSYTWTNVAAGSYSITAKAYDNSTGTATTSARIITVNNPTSNQAPTVSLSSPSNNASFTAPASVTISATATDADGSISKVEFYNGSTLLNSDNTSPYSYTWTNVAAGSYSITAKAYDNANATTTSSIAVITVNSVTGGTCSNPAWGAATAYNGGALVSYNGRNYKARWWTQNDQPDLNTASGKPWEDLGACSGGTNNQNPVVNLTAPSTGSTYTAPASVTISANASDSDGSISKVEFYNGSMLLNSDNSSPYSYTWTNVAAGSYSITAKAYDNSTGTATTTAVTITVNGATNQIPVVSLTSPSGSDSYIAQATITISANASDADGSISKVEFYNGGTLLNSDNSAPYSYSWTNVSAGTYSITAKAYDNTGATTTSSVVSVTVQPSSNGGTCGTTAQYVENGGYSAGSKVKNGGSLYECKPYPYSGWCNGAAWAYAPGTGAYWADAWTKIGTCTAKMSATSSTILPNEGVTPNPSYNVSTILLNIESSEATTEQLIIMSSNGFMMKNYQLSLKEGLNEIEVDINTLKEGIYLIKIGEKTFRFVKAQ